MGYWIKCLGVITTTLVLSFPSVEGLRKGEKLEISPAFAQDISYSQSNSQSEIDKLLKEGEAYYQNWEYEKALKKFEQVLKLREQMSDKAAEARALFYVGATYNKLQQGEKALDYYWEVMAVAEEASNPKEFEKITKYLCRNQAGKQFLKKEKFLQTQNFDVDKYCEGIPWEGDSSSVTLLLDEDDKKK